MNTVEFFIHVEDVRRAQGSWQPRLLADEMAAALWSRVGAGGMAKEVGGTVEIMAPGLGAKEGGNGRRVTIAGDPGELTLFIAGRQAAAKVEMSGDAHLADRLRSASLGI
jgi:uncharacterized protein (TIGR03085 family)